MSCGVPQGTVLGPGLFTIFLNDVYQIGGKGKIIRYADDVSVCFVLINVMIH